VIVALLLLIQEPPKPGKEHEILKAFEGQWETHSRFDMGGRIEESKGTFRARFACGGFWLVSEAEGDMGGMKFEGLGLMGYDQDKKKYVATWCDNMGSRIDISEGTYDEKTRTITLHSEGPDMTGKPTKWKWLYTIKDKDHWTLRFVVAGDKDVEVGSIEVKRRK
jgi:hypothetical protein